MDPAVSSETIQARSGYKPTTYAIVMPKCKHVHSKIVGKSKAAASEGAAVEALEESLAMLVAERAGCGTAYEIAENSAAATAANQELDALHARAARKEEERKGYVWKAPWVVVRRLTEWERKANTAAERATEARAAALRATAVERVRRGNPTLGIKGVAESDPSFETRVSQVLVLVEKEAAAAPVAAVAPVAPVAVVAAVAGGLWGARGGGTNSVSRADEAVSWRKTF